MTKTSAVSVRLRPDLNRQLTEIAASLDRSKSWVVEQAVQEFVAVRDWQLAAIDEGLKAADEGRVADHDAVAAWVASWDTSDETPPPSCE